MLAYRMNRTDAADLKLSDDETTKRCVCISVIHIPVWLDRRRQTSSFLGFCGSFSEIFNGAISRGDVLKLLGQAPCFWITNIHRKHGRNREAKMNLQLLMC